MKIKIWLVLFICLPFIGQAQITINSQIPNTGILLKDQLWNLIVTNNSNDIVNVKVDLDITDVVLGQSVLNASTGKITIGKGIKIITIRDIQPIVYNYVATEFTGKYTPCGTYSLHYRLLTEVPGKGDVPIADDITRIYVSPLSPTLLSLPSDKSGIETVYPQFAWMPPSPMEMFSPLLYDINVVAIEDGQTVREAIELNKPVYFNTNIQNPSDKMPSSFGQLQQGKSYAWQIVARSGSVCASASDVWMFTIGKDSITKIIESAAFIKLSTSNTEITTATEGVLKMEYINNIGDKQVKCIVYKSGEKQKEGHKEIRFKLKLVNGQNYLSYSIDKKHKLEEKTVYEVALINSRGEQWLMRFMPMYSNKN
jgi:hypothetical protein